MKAKVIKEECIGCGLCEQICPEVFTMDDEGTAEAIKGEVPADAEECAQEAADSCPTGAIEIE